tara:strand:- start:2489 stop:2710 length:222 start_codon:yes stop_codon:yes gene_type:complete
MLPGARDAYTGRGSMRWQQEYARQQQKTNKNKTDSKITAIRINQCWCKQWRVFSRLASKATRIPVWVAAEHRW